MPPFTKYREDINSEELNEVQTIAQLEALEKQLDLTEASGPDTTDKILNIGKSFLDLTAIAQQEVNHNATVAALSKAKDDLDEQLAEMSVLPLLQRGKKLKDPKFKEDSLKTFEDSVKDLPSAAKSRAILQYTSLFSKSLLKANIAFIKDNKKLRSNTTKQALENVKNNAAISEEEGLRAETEAIEKGLLSQEEARKSFVEGTIERLADKSNVVKLKELKDKSQDLDIKNQAAKKVPEAERKALSEAKRIAKGFKTPEDLVELSGISNLSGNKDIANFTQTIINSILDTFNTSSSRLRSTSSEELRKTGLKLGLDQDEIIEVIDSLQDSRIVYGSVYYNLMKDDPEAFNKLSLEEKSDLGLAPISVGDMQDLTKELIMNPDNADSVLLKKSLKINVAPELVLLHTLDFIEANSSKEDHDIRDKVAVLRAIKLTGAETEMTVSELFKIIDDNKTRIPSTRGNIDVDAKLLTNDNQSDVIRLQEIASFYEITQNPNTSKRVSSHDEDFTQTFRDSVEAKVGGENFFTRMLNALGFGNDRPAVIPPALWNKMDENKRKNILDNIKALSEFELEEDFDLSEESKELVETQGVSIVPYKDSDGKIYSAAYVEGRLPRILRNADGSLRAHSVVDLMSGNINGYSKGVRIEDIKSPYLKVVNEVVKKAGYPSKKLPKPLKPSIEVRDQVKEAINIPVNITVDGKKQSVTLKRGIKHALKREGLNESLAPIIIAQLMKESGRWGKGSKNFDPTKFNESNVIGYAQAGRANFKKYLDMGIDVRTKGGSLKFMIKELKASLNRSKKLLKGVGKEDSSLAVFAAITFYLKNYNGTGYNTVDTLQRSLKRIGSDGADENRNYSSGIMSPYKVPTKSEISISHEDRYGKANYSKIKGSKPEYDVWRLRKLRNSLSDDMATAQALWESGYNLKETRDLINNGKLEDLFNATESR